MLWIGDKEVRALWIGGKEVRALWCGAKLAWEKICCCFGSGTWHNRSGWDNDCGWLCEPQRKVKEEETGGRACATPVISISEAGLCEIECATEGACVYYCLEEGDRMPALTLYLGPFSVTGDGEVRAMAVKPGWGVSKIGALRYSVDPMLTDYMPLEWVRSDGMQWIDTGIKFAERLGFVADATLDGLGGLLGAYGNTGYIGIWYYNADNKVDFFWKDTGTTFAHHYLYNIFPGERHVYTFNKDRQSKKDEEQACGAMTAFVQPTGNTHLLACAQQDNMMSHATLYSAAAYDNDSHEWLRRWVPCMAKVGGRIGLYDRIGGGFLYSPSSLIPGECTGRKPSMLGKYRRVKCLISSGTQYIDCNVCAADDVGIRCDFQALNTADTVVIGQRKETNSGRLWINPNNNWVKLSWNAMQATGQTVNGARVDCKLNLYNDRKGFIDGTLNRTIDESLASGRHRNILLFAANSGDSVTLHASTKVYSAQITKGSRLVRDLCPVVRIEDGVPGMWDRVYGVFMPNIGTGVLAYEEGPECAEVSVWVEDGLVYASCVEEGAVIRYTDDDTEPTEESPVYSQPLEADEEEGYCYRFKAFAEGFEPSSEARAKSISFKYEDLYALESTGEEWVETDVIPDAQTTVECLFEAIMPQGKLYPRVFGTQNSSVSEYAFLACLYDNINFYGKVCNGTNAMMQTSFIASNGDVYKVSLRLNRFIVERNGTESNYTASETMPTLTVPMHIFSGNCPNKTSIFTKGELNSKIRLMWLKVYRSGSLMRSYKPVRRIADSALGLYESQTRSFLQNASGKGTFVAVEESQRYKFLDYIESDGGQWIDSGYVFQVGDTVECGLVDTVTNVGGSSRLFFGSRTEGSGGNIFDSTVIVARDKDCFWYDHWRVRNKDSALPADLDISFSATNVVVRDTAGNVLHDRTGTRSANGTVSLYLYAINNGTSSPTIQQGAKISYFRVKGPNGDYLLDLQPCCRISDGKPGLFDRVSGLFLTNQGTGEFIPGPAND